MSSSFLLQNYLHPYDLPPVRRNRMASSLDIKKILAEYRHRLIEILGAELDSVLLFGSQARGEAGAGSDIDVLCVMKNQFDYGDLISRTSLATAEISLKHDVVISRVFVTREAYAFQDSPFLMNVRKEQVAV
jgi:predicted nucleotidyltransferase